MKLLVAAGRNIKAVGYMHQGSAYREWYDMAYNLMSKGLFKESPPCLEKLRDFMY